MQQVYLPYYLWEEWRGGMWADSDTSSAPQALQFMKRTGQFGIAMREVIRRWPNSCLHNLSNSSINRRAWIGQAAVCISINISESVTRTAWHALTDIEQQMANEKADGAIQDWEQRTLRGIQLCLNIG